MFIAYVLFVLLFVFCYLPYRMTVLWALFYATILSVRHTRDPRQNGSTYRNTFTPYDRAMFRVSRSEIL